MVGTAQDIVTVLTPIIAAALWCVELWLVLILLAHTAAVLGARTPLYKKKPITLGWNKRFYPAIVLLMAFVAVQLWLVEIML